MPKKSFDREFLRDVIWDGADGAKKLKDEMVSKDRWTVTHKLIFSHEDKCWLVYYRVGATEYQDEGPFDYDGENIECTEVEPFEKTVVRYRLVKED